MNSCIVCGIQLIVPLINNKYCSVNCKKIHLKELQEERMREERMRRWKRHIK